MPAAVAIASLTAVAPAAQGASFRSCDGQAVVVAVRNTTCQEGGLVYRAYVKSCVADASGKRRLTCRVRKFTCVFKAKAPSNPAAGKTEDVVGIATCSRGKRRVVFAVTRTVPVP